MLDRDRIRALIPHQGAMCLLDHVTEWSAEAIHCRARSHLDPANPLRRRGRLSTICGLEYALQAAALHGALLAGGAPQPAGYLAALRDVALHASHLDDPALGLLGVEAVLRQRGPAGLAYGFRLLSEAGRCLASGRGTIALPRV